MESTGWPSELVLTILDQTRTVLDSDKACLYGTLDSMDPSVCLVFLQYIHTHKFKIHTLVSQARPLHLKQEGLVTSIL